MNLQGKRALVTGAGRGVGRGCALELARAGADIVVNDRSESEDVASLLSEIQALGRQAVAVCGDAFDRTACEDVVTRAVVAFERIDILVSNPAFSKRCDFLEIDPALFRQVLDGTLGGGFHIGQLVARHMVSRGGGGKLIFISSVQARIPAVRSAPYNAAKAGLNQMVFTIAAELARHRINVNVIEPGWIDTPNERATFGDEHIAEHGPKLPWGRLGTPADIGKAAAFLASDDADYITGASLVVDGGFWLRGAG